MRAPSQQVRLFVNGERIPDELILDEVQRLRSAPQFASIADPVARERQLIGLGLSGAIDRILIKQEADKDTSPVAEDDVKRELDKLRSGPCAASASTAALHTQAETQARFSRTARKLVGQIAPPPRSEIVAFFKSN